MKHYILNDDGNPVFEPDFPKWSEWFESADTHIAYEMIDDSRISTIFLGMDAGLAGGPPLGEMVLSI